MWSKWNCMVIWTFFSIALLGMEMKTDLFQSCGCYCGVFQICWHTECSTLTASPLRIWNNSAGIPSLPLALFVVMEEKRMRWLMASLTQWTWVRVNPGSWWCTGRPGVLQFMELLRVGHDWATELKLKLNAS